MRAKSQRTSTMIALRARREALEIARDIAYPHVDVPRSLAPVPVEPLEPLWPEPTRREPLWYELWPSESTLSADAEPAPWWIGWLLAACLLSIATATWLILATV